jgi:hypothetical protein
VIKALGLVAIAGLTAITAAESDAATANFLNIIYDLYLKVIILESI